MLYAKPIYVIMLIERWAKIMSTINSVLAKNISIFRKQKSLTQEMLAELIGVSYQAVSKWETEKCLPDITVLPKLSDVFECSIDDLFSKTTNCKNIIDWENDDTIRCVVFEGKRILKASVPTDYQELKKITFEIEGDVKSIECQCNLSVSGSVSGGVTSNGEITVCGNLSGGVNCCGDVTAGFHISGGVNANGEVIVGGNLTGEIHTNRDVVVKGNVSAGTIESDGKIKIEGKAEVDRITGDIICTELECERIEGNVTVSKSEC